MKSRAGSAGVSRRKGSTRSETQLVLLFIFLLVMCYTVIVRKHIYMPVDPNITEQEEQKHGRSERAQLQAEFTRQGMNSIGKELQHAFISVEEAAAKALHHGHVDHKQGSGVGHVPEEVWRERQSEVVKAAKESWAAYELHAFGFDELEPIKQKGKNNFGALGAMIADCLDTLWLFGLREEFDRARDWVVNSMNFNSMAKLSLFETNIRILGGLLAAYDLSQDVQLLNKAKDLADRLLPNFDLATTGIPRNLVLLKPQMRGVPKQPMGASRAALAEYGTFTLEFMGLSHRTNNPEYGAKAEAIIKGLYKRNADRGLLPVWINRSSGKFQGRELLTMGAMADSYYEYLLKTWLYTRKQQEMYRIMWEKATDEALAKLVRVGKDGYQYLGILNGANVHVLEQDNYSSQMEHLACYFPGNVALGVHTGAVKGAKAALYLEAAKNLTATCWHMYAKQPTGLSPEVEYFAGSSGGAGSSKAGAGIRAANLLRPETVESLWYMWRVTHEQQWRDYGWTMFQSFQKHCRQPDGAYSGIHDVRQVNSSFTNGMETFWVAETLKYFWLLFGPDDVLHWDTVILNTEAHPLFLSNMTLRSVDDIAAAKS